MTTWKVGDWFYPLLRRLENKNKKINHEDNDIKWTVFRLRMLYDVSAFSNGEAELPLRCVGETTCAVFYRPRERMLIQWPAINYMVTGCYRPVYI